MSASLRMLVVSTYNLGKPLWGGLTYDACRVLSEESDVDVLAPADVSMAALRVARKIVSGASHSIGRRRLSSFTPVAVEGTYDLMVFVCMSPRDLDHIRNIKGWRTRCRKAAVVILEIWSSQLSKHRAQLKSLDTFDDVFICNNAALANVQAYTSAKCHFVAPGVDCLSAVPTSLDSARPIDFYSMGRRSEDVHIQLLAKANSSDFFYMYDVGSGVQVYDFAQARFLTFSVLKRTRYFTAYDHSVGPKADETAGEQALTMRLFEGAASGTVMIGSATKCPEYDEEFGWEDALVEIPQGRTNICSLIAQLDSDPDRVRRARFMNTTQSLLRHDWAYRWEHVMSACGFDPSTRFRKRKENLHAHAQRIEREFSVQ